MSVGAFVADDGAMTRSRFLAATAVVFLSLPIAAGCSSDGGSDGGSDTTVPGGEEKPTVEMALEEDLPSEEVEVPSEDGSTSIADYSQGTSDYESSAPEELNQILSLVGVQADGYITKDAVVVQASEADAAMWCRTHQSLGMSTYTLIPVLSDGTGVDCG
jgi:hypothetical protein